MSGKQKSFKKGSQKSFASKRRINPPQARRDVHAPRGAGAPFQQEDVKRRLVSASQEVGLVATTATMRLLPSGGSRLIYVGASFPDWPYETPTISLMATVPLTGSWPETIDIRCCATEGDPALTFGPWLRSRMKCAIHGARGRVASHIGRT